MMDAGAEVRKAREAAGLTQRALAKRAGVPQPRIAEYERGRAVPGVDQLSRLLRACGWRLETAADPGVSDDDLQLLRLHLAMTPAQRLAAFTRRARLRGAARRV